MIDVSPSVPNFGSPRVAAQTASQKSDSSDSQEAAEEPQPKRLIEKLSTAEAQAVRMDPAIQELLQLFGGEIKDIVKDMPSAATDNSPATTVEIPVDTDDEEELQ